MTSATQVRIPAMAFFNPDGIKSAWEQATRFAGSGGRIATMPDIIDACLATKLGTPPWENYFTTATAEYVGRDESGRRILIVAHGVGPMSTLEGIEKAYRWHGRKVDRNGGRISMKEFNKLRNGKYGEVAIVDLEEYLTRYQYPFIQDLTVGQAIDDPVLRARLGPRAEEYIIRHADSAYRWHRRQIGVKEENRYNLPNWDEYLERQRRGHQVASIKGMDIPILVISGPSGCPYGFNLAFEADCKARCDSWDLPLDRDNMVLAHLVSIGGLAHYKFSNHPCAHLARDVGCHGKSNGVRLVGIKADSTLSSIHPGFDVGDIMTKNWRKLMVPTTSDEVSKLPKLLALMKFSGRFWVQCPKTHNGMDTHEPMMVVTRKREFGKAVVFTTEGYGSPFFKFDTKEVQAIAPEGANAYMMGEPWVAGNDHKCMVQFYRIEADTTQRLVRKDSLKNDYDRLVELSGIS